MTRNEVRAQHLGNLLAGLTGVVFFGLKYFTASEDPYSASATHPFESVAQAAHVVVAPFLIFTVGLIWKDHIYKKIIRRRVRRRISGVVLVSLFLPMALTAYLIQVTVDDTWRRFWVIIHLATGGLWIVGYIVHLLKKPKP